MALKKSDTLTQADINAINQSNFYLIGVDLDQAAGDRDRRLSLFDLINVGGVSGIQDNLNATVAPTVNDDSSAGYAVGSKWIDTTADEAYVCLDASAGAAVWQILTGDEKDNITTTDPTVNDDSTQGYEVGSRWFNSTTDTLFFCEDASAGAAGWTAIGSPSSLDPINISFNSNGAAYVVAHEAMTIQSAIEGGTGTLAYAKALAADTTAFTTGALPQSFAVGDVLRVTVSGLATYKSVSLQRSA